ncbi:MAG: CvpA family protein [Burkholderiales bacterium]
MTVFDYAVLSVIGLSMLLSFTRGMVTEALALGSWIASTGLAVSLSALIAPMLPAAIPGQTLRVLCAFVVVFLIAFLAFTLVSIALRGIVKALKLGPLDRVLGLLFGLARGMVIVMLLVFLAGLTPLPRHTYWKHAMFSAALEALVLYVSPWLPHELSRQLRYD